METNYRPSPTVQARCISLGLPHLTLAPGPGVPPSTGLQYPTSQPALLCLVAHFRQIGQISRPTGVMHNAPHYPYLQALALLCRVIPSSSARACSVFPVLAATSAQNVGGGYDRHLLQSSSHRARLIKVALSL